MASGTAYVTISEKCLYWGSSSYCLLFLWQIFIFICCIIFLANIFVTSSSTNCSETVWNAMADPDKCNHEHLVANWIQKWILTSVLYWIKLALLLAKYFLYSSFQHWILFFFSQTVPLQDVYQAVRLTMPNYLAAQKFGRWIWRFWQLGRQVVHMVHSEKCGTWFRNVIRAH